MPDNLISRIEAAGEDQQRALLEEAWGHLVRNYSGYWERLTTPEMLDRFKAMLDASAWESAVMMLRGDWMLDYIQEHSEGYSTAGLYKRNPLVLTHDRISAAAATVALALLAAILKAKEMGDE